MAASALAPISELKISPDNVLVIFNPAAGSGRLGARELDIRAELKQSLGRTPIASTSKKGHARELAANLSSNIQMVVAIGGDGTVHETACGLAESNSSAGMAVIPMGTGNDFARALKMPIDWRKAINEIRSAKKISSDMGQVKWKEEGGDFSDYFVNALGIGFDAFCAHLAPKYKGWPFGIGYTASIVAGLREWVSSGATVWDTSFEKKPIFSGRMMFTTIGNAQDSGGGYTVNPKALISDGLLDACIVEDLSFFRALSILPSARDGKHLSKKEVSYFQLQNMLIETDRGLPIHSDGEVKTLQARLIEVNVLPGKIAVFVPNSAPEIL
ncbi:MAG: diacylglycerol kinase family lipid kinase [Bacteroidetes bacterium]|nr:diacylglycerol kinase family lipid kinase [Bacteroidota bacterium]